MRQRPRPKHRFVFDRASSYALRRLRSELAMDIRHKGSLLLVDIPDYPDALLEHMALAKYLCERHAVEPAAYVPGIRMRWSTGVLGRLRNIAHPHARGMRYASRLGVPYGLGPSAVDQAAVAEACTIYQTLRDRIKSRHDLVQLTIGGVAVGRAVYDTYLRQCRQRTLDLSDPKFAEALVDACLVYVVARRFFSGNDVTYVVLGHAAYVNWLIVSDIARKAGAQVYVTYNAPQRPLHDVNANRGLPTKDHTRYPHVFRRLNEADQERALDRGRQLVENRLSGVLDEGIGYMARSPYNGEFGQAERQVPENAVLIMLHSFYDSPHIYSRMVFADFWEWACFSLEQLEAAGISKRHPVLLKPHPARLEGEDKIVDDLLARFGFCQRIADDVSNSEILDAAPRCAITVYGTVIPEFTYRGVPVIACGDNPTSAYPAIAYEAHDREEYIRLLQDIPALTVRPSAKRSVAEFMYMHYLYGDECEPAYYPFGRARRGQEDRGLSVVDFSYDRFSAALDRVALLR